MLLVTRWVRTMMTDEQMNIFLDKILDSRKHFDDLKENINQIVDMVDQAIQSEGPFNDEDLRSLYDTIPQLKSYYNTLSELILYLKEIDTIGIATEQISSLRLAIQDIEKCYQHLESIFLDLQDLNHF